MQKTLFTENLKRPKDVYVSFQIKKIIKMILYSQGREYLIANQGCIINNTRNLQEIININTRIRQIYSDR